jgi:hypothetical protein
MISLSMDLETVPAEVVGASTEVSSFLHDESWSCFRLEGHRASKSMEDSAVCPDCAKFTQERGVVLSKQFRADSFRGEVARRKPVGSIRFKAIFNAPRL